MDWLHEQIYVVLRLGHNEVSTRTWVRTFVLPSLFPTAVDGGVLAEVRARLGVVAARARDLDEAVKAVTRVADGS